MRRHYETEADLELERDVVRRCNALFKCEMFKLPIRYHLDYVALRGDKAVSWVEIKTRTYTAETLENYGGYLLSLGKWLSCEHLYRCTGLPITLVVKPIDALYYLVLTEFKHDGVFVRGRKDRNDWQDVEPCVVINTDRFTKLK